MQFFRRMNAIVAANFNELLDQVENPELMLKHAVGEMESELGRALDTASQVIASERLLDKRLSATLHDIEQSQRQAQQAAELGQDDAARQALRRRRALEQQAALLRDQHQAAQTAGQQLRCRIDAMRSDLTLARDKLLSLSTRQRAVDMQRRMLRSFGELQASSDSFGRFGRLSERIERAEAELEAFIELTHGRCETADTLDEHIEAELAELNRRAAMSGQSG